MRTRVSALRQTSDAYNDSMDAKRDVLIVGGGVIGLTTAYFLAQQRMRVAVVDKGEFGHESSWAGAGIINPGSFDHATTPLNRLLGLSTMLYPSLSRELLEATGIDNGYRRCGGIELRSGVDQAMVETWRKEKIRFEAVPAREMRRIEPEFAAIAEDGYYLPDMAQVRNPRHMRALYVACDKLGVECLPQRAVEGFRREGSRIVAAVTEKGELAADRFLIAAGAWSRQILEAIGVGCDIRPVRGQIVLFNPCRVLFKAILSCGKRYLVPRSDGRVLAGSTEEEVGHEKRNTPEGVAQLTRLAHEWIPALRDVPVETTWAGLRPGTHRDVPFLGPVPGFENLHLAAGHFRAGLMLSPGTGLAMSQMLQSQSPAIPMEPFAPDRR
jgi:glycine oxidase